jgi:methyltransferase (TIGR00027 family)
MPAPIRNAPIRNVSDTALWVAMYRAAETERPDAIFRDPYARRLAGDRGAEILASMRRGMDWPMIVRTAVMDEIVLRCVQQGCKSVLNLAAGLDARAWRLPLSPALHWIDADLPDMVAYKQQQLGGEKTACVY